MTLYGVRGLVYRMNAWRSLTMRGKILFNGYTLSTEEWTHPYHEATCYYYDHSVPYTKCDCGLYAWIGMDEMLNSNLDYDSLFLVECNGKIIVHDNNVIRCEIQQLQAVLNVPANYDDYLEHFVNASEYFNIPIISAEEAFNLVANSLALVLQDA